MSRTTRWAQWTVIGAAVLLLFWLAALLGGSAPDIRRLSMSVHGPLVADYRAESPQMLAPLSPDITRDASRDQASAANPRPSASPSAGPSPNGTGTSPTPTGSGTALPTLPVATPSLPAVTPTLPIATPTPVPTPSLPTPPPLP
jgi:hypothetical protein